jgi:hypothetical protein
MLRNLISATVIASGLMIFPALADNTWIGSGSATPSGFPAKATVKWVKQDGSGWAKFTINESSANVPADRVWKFDGNSSVGKNWLAILLAAKSAGQDVQFYEIENYPAEGSSMFWKIDGITLGGN